jgi:hypothetical protein
MIGLSLHCEGVVMAWLQQKITIPEAHTFEELCIARTLALDIQEIRVRVVNATRSDWKLKKEVHLAHCEPVMVTPADVEQSQI